MNSCAAMPKKHRKIGIDVALEALHEGWRKRRVTMDEFWRYAQLDHVTKIVMPVLPRNSADVPE